MKTSHKIMIGVLVLIGLLVVARYTILEEQFNNWGEGLERIDEWEDDYRSKNPNASDAEVDAAFKAGIADITIWKEKYKQENPGATDADADAAFNAMWDN